MATKRKTLASVDSSDIEDGATSKRQKTPIPSNSSPSHEYSTATTSETKDQKAEKTKERISGWIVCIEEPPDCSNKDIETPKRPSISFFTNLLDLQQALSVAAPECKGVLDKAIEEGGVLLSNETRIRITKHDADPSKIDMESFDDWSLPESAPDLGRDGSAVRLLTRSAFNEAFQRLDYEMVISDETKTFALTRDGKTVFAHDWNEIPVPKWVVAGWKKPEADRGGRFEDSGIILTVTGDSRFWNLKSYACNEDGFEAGLSWNDVLDEARIDECLKDEGFVKEVDEEKDDDEQVEEEN